MAKLQQQVADLKSAAGQGVGELSERDQLIAKQFEADQAKLQKIRLLLVRYLFFSCLFLLSAF